jgi:hypothetical protein
MDNINSLIFCLLLIGVSLPVDAGIYKWTDENGKVHYTQRPPPKNGQSKTINSDTFNSVDMVKAPAIPRRTVKTSTQVIKQEKSESKKSKSKKRGIVGRSGCKRR